MKKISDGITVLAVLFFLGAILFGALKEGYIIPVLLFITFIILLFRYESSNQRKKENERITIIENDRQKKFNSIVYSIRINSYEYAFKNNRLRKIIYDIEEGGDYVSNYESSVIEEIDEIIDRTIPFLSDNPESYVELIHQKILELKVVKEKRQYLGFD